MWLVKIAVGTLQHWTFSAESTGRATASEHLPKLEKSFMTAAFTWRLWSGLSRSISMSVFSGRTLYHKAHGADAAIFGIIGAMASTRVNSAAASLAALMAVAAATCAASPMDVVSPHSGTRYATDAYPGFDDDDEVVTSEKKTPRWFSWINGPSRTNAVEQLEYARSCETNESWSSARKAYDALVREWPESPEAPLAQESLARLFHEKEADYERAFREYKYLVDFYPSKCAFDAVAEKMYGIAKAMREKGTTFMLVRFENKSEARRAFEAVILRAPGAKYAPEAMLAVGEIREAEGEWDKAVLVYENLRSQHGASEEARTALVREGAARMKLLRDHGYNRARCRDTADFLRMALASGPSSSARAELERWLQEANGLLDDEAWQAARFYDSKTRTRRSAVEAYERFLAENPASAHAQEARSRLAELKGASK